MYVKTMGSSGALGCIDLLQRENEKPSAIKNNRNLSMKARRTLVAPKRPHLLQRERRKVEK